MKLRVRFFAAYRETVGFDEITMESADGIRIGQLFREILEKYPVLKKFKKGALFAVNREFADADQKLVDGDEVAIMPPLGGG